MTARTASPQETVAQFVSLAERIVDRALARHRPELCRQAQPVTLAQIIGAGWSVIVDGAQVDRGADPALHGLAQLITQHAARSLDVEGQTRLLSKMRPTKLDVPGSVDPHFSCALVLDGEVFSLRVEAISGSFRAVVGHCEGVLEPARAVA